VEVAGVEPASEKDHTEGSTSVSRSLISENDYSIEQDESLPCPLNLPRAPEAYHPGQSV